MANEKRLIDANALLEKIQFRRPIIDTETKIVSDCVRIARETIVNAPTVDAVEVVRCKHCKSCDLHYPEKQIDKEATPGWYCKVHKKYRRPDDFCSHGERRGGE